MLDTVGRIGGQIAQLLLMCDRHDIGISIDSEPDPLSARVFIYDNYPGGIGLSTPLYDRRREVVQQAYALVTACACLQGCPACVGPILAAGEQEDYTPKEAARIVLSLLRGESCNGS